MVEAVLVEPDVAAAQRLTRLLDKAGNPPRAVLWVYSHDTSRWRLWIVPKEPVSDLRAFYTDVSILIESENSLSAEIDVGMINVIDEANPAIRGLKNVIRADGVSSIRFTDNVLNGVYLPDAIIVRMAV